MAYTALYRKWRPKSFSEVVSQEAVVKTLTNQVKNNRVGHAYLFCGTRGTGKTTIAKIFARAVNCEHPVDGSPCNECPACKAILSGASMNVVEIDAASNNGVDNIREIREEVKYSPTEGNYRVYIIDEVHMLSAGAYNALLKTLEEPPSYVIFILATTEVHKIPVTVLSRCQRYDFKRISAKNIEAQLKKLTAEENIETEPKALTYIARAADGAMRDALSILEECISYYYGQTLTYENVLDVVGAVDVSVFSDLLDKILSKDVTSAMKIIEELIYSGRDIGQTVGDFVWFLRNILLIQTSQVTEEDLGISSENFESLKSMALRVSMDILMKYIRIFSDLENSLRVSTEKRTLLEVSVIRAMRPEMETDISGMRERISVLEDKLAEIYGGQFVPDASFRKPVAADGGEPAEEIAVPAADYDDLIEIQKNWTAIMRTGSGMFSGSLDRLTPSYKEGVGFIIIYDKMFNADLFDEGRRAIVDEAASKIINKEVHFEWISAEQADPRAGFVKKDGEVPGIGIKIGEE